MKQVLFFCILFSILLPFLYAFLFIFLHIACGVSQVADFFLFQFVDEIHL